MIDEPFESEADTIARKIITLSLRSGATLHDVTVSVNSAMIKWVDVLGNRLPDSTCIIHKGKRHKLRPYFMGE